MKMNWSAFLKRSSFIEMVALFTWIWEVSWYSKTFKNNTSKRKIWKFDSHLCFMFLFTMLSLCFNLDESYHLLHNFSFSQKFFLHSARHFVHKIFSSLIQSDKFNPSREQFVNQISNQDFSLPWLKQKNVNKAK